jgi:hypothetical protein
VAELGFSGIGLIFTKLTQSVSAENLGSLSLTCGASDSHAAGRVRQASRRALLRPPMVGSGRLC